MHIALIGLFCAEYPIALANALARSNQVTLFLSMPHLALRFPAVSKFDTWLRERRIVDETISLRLIDHPTTGRYLQKISMAFGLAQSIRELHPDVVHYQSGGTLWFPLAMSRLRRFPLVVTIHDVTHHTGDRPSKAILVSTNFLVSHLSHEIIVHGQHQAEALSRTYRTPRKKVNVVPMGSFPLYKAFWGGETKQDGQVVLFFGRMRAYKGLEVLIKAAPIIAARIPNVRIVIAGAGECESAHRAARERPDLFEIHNRYIPAEEVPNLFQRAALVVLPYLDATQTAVAPLAYLFGKPVVATAVGSIPEIVDDGKTGLLVAPGDELALAKAVATLLEDPKRREAMGQAAAAKVEQDLSWDSIAAKTLAVYNCASEAAKFKREASGAREQ